MGMGRCLKFDLDRRLIISIKCYREREIKKKSKRVSTIFAECPYV